MKYVIFTFLLLYLTVISKAQESHYSTEQVLFILKVKDKSTGKPIAAQLEIKSITEGPNSFHGKGKTDNNGHFELKLVVSENVRIKLQKNHYMPINEVIDFKADLYAAGDTVIKEFYMNGLEVGKAITLTALRFETGKSNLMPESYDQIETLLMLMKSNPKMVIELGGHTDNTGGKGYSQQLSEDRVEEVKRILVEKGIKKSHIKGVGYGGTKPIASNRDEQGREKNRRVEFKIVKIE